MKTIVRMLPVLVCLLMLGGHCASPTRPAGKSQDQPTQKLPATGASLEQTALHPTTIAATPTPVAARHLRLAFVQDWGDDNWEVFIATMDGSEMINVSNHPARDKYPTWSPNGDYLAFTSMRDDMANVYVVRSDGSALTRVSKDGGTGPAWSPDSTRLAFTGGDGDLYIVQPDGSHLTRLTHGPGEDVGAVWSPDGGCIAFRTEWGDAHRISLMHLDELHQTAVLATSRPFAPLIDRMVWSPDGQQLAVSVESKESTSIVRRDGTLQAHLSNFWAPSWLPEGNRFLGISLSNDNEMLATIEADGEQKKYMGFVGRDPMMSPDQRQIAFVSYNDPHKEWTKIYVANVDGSIRCQLSTGAGSDSKPAWSPDGSHIAFIRRTGTLHDGGGLMMVAIDSTEETVIVPGEVLSRPVWQPLPPQPESQVYFPLLMRSSGVGKGRY